MEGDRARAAGLAAVSVESVVADQAAVAVALEDLVVVEISAGAALGEAGSRSAFVFCAFLAPVLT